MSEVAGVAGSLLTLGPVLFNWTPERWRDFYFRIADEAPVDVVFLGEIVCSKRTPFSAPFLANVLERLTAAGKQTVLASPILVANGRERQALRDLADLTHLTVEANDLGALRLLDGRPHAIGPFVNVYNEGTLAYLARRGATSVCLPAELSRPAILAMAELARALGTALELQVFGRVPLAISARCYHARAHGLHKDGCQFVCANDDDGMPVDTLTGEPFLAVNGTQTLSRTCLALAGELSELREAGVMRYRLSPHSCDMVAVASHYRALLDGRIAPAELLALLRQQVAAVMPLANGFYHGIEGAAFAATA